MSFQFFRFDDCINKHYEDISNTCLETDQLTVVTEKVREMLYTAGMGHSSCGGMLCFKVK